MKGDFSRVTFDPKKRYSSTRMQQGRVQVDADWNEQMDIFNHRIQMETNDFIGGPGAPDANPGFKITVKDGAMKIGAGRYYVNGLLCENMDLTDFTQQFDYPNVALPTADGSYLAYLDVWQLHVTAIEDSRIREVALGGADTTTRVRNIAQVKIFLAGTSNTTLENILTSDEWKNLTMDSTGKLSVQLINPNQLSNQLYRVEIHQGGEGTAATYKWSRENASVAAAVQEITVDSSNKATINLDQLQSALPNTFTIGQWIEISNNEMLLHGKPGLLTQIEKVTDNQLTIIWDSNYDPKQFTPNNLATLRLWEGGNAVSVALNTNINLENGLTIKFKKGTLRTGDYWLIPTRAINNSIDWPNDDTGKPLSQTPHGIKHYYAPLATGELASGNWSITDCRTLFSPIMSFKELNTLEAAQSAPNGSIYVDGDGHVGIGTDTPASKLEVVGITTLTADSASKPALQLNGNANIVGKMDIIVSDANAISTKSQSHSPTIYTENMGEGDALQVKGAASIDLLKADTLKVGNTDNNDSAD